ncbi:hypothetical protein JZ785_24475 [Alicyclobacillus curvatus]|nr:hypothetical protein JZ785_24475 [Alicyclobacillus curvatus]
MAFGGAFVFMLCILGFQLYVNPARFRTIKETEIIWFLLGVVVVAVIGAEALIFFAKGVIHLSH